jgi:hypothetical protein
MLQRMLFVRASRSENVSRPAMLQQECSRHLPKG